MPEDPDEAAKRRLEDEEGGGNEKEDNLAALVGRTVLDLNTGFLGVVKTREDRRTGQRVYWLSGEGGRAQNLNIGATLVDPNTRQVINVDPTGGVAEGGKLSESDLARLFGVDDGGGGGGGGGAPSYMSTQAAQSAQFAHDQNMANLNAQLAEAQAARDYKRTRELQLLILQEQQDFADEQRVASEKFQAEQNRLAEEAMLKRERLGVLQNLVEGFLQSQQRASEFVLQLQPDQFRFAAAAQGMPVLGTTPQEGYAEALTEFAGRPTPSMDPNAPLSAIEGGIESIMGQRVPLAPDMYGRMAGGGTVPMGASGTFLVGERGPEVMEVSPTGVTVKPLSGGFAYGGGVDFDVSSIYAGLAPLYAALGFENVPTVTRRGSRGDIYFNPRGSGFESGKDFLTSLGIKPNLVRDPFSHKVFYREGETLRHIPNAEAFEEMGFNWRDVINLHPSTFADYGWETGQPLTEAPEFVPRTIGPMGNMPFATIEPLTGAVLPAPYRVAAERRRLSGVDPVTYGLGTSAYGFRGGIPGAALTSAEDIFTPRGMPRGLLGLR